MRFWALLLVVFVGVSTLDLIASQEPSEENQLNDLEDDSPGDDWLTHSHVMGMLANAAHCFPVGHRLPALEVDPSRPHRPPAA